MSHGINYTLKAGGMENFLLSSSGGYDNLPNGSWVHVVSTFDGTNFAGYIDATQVASLVTNLYVEDNLNDFLIGNRHTLDRQFKGRVDDVKVYRRGLTAAEVTNLYLTGTASTGARTNSIPAPGGYTNAALPNLRRYAVSAWLDRNASGAKDGSDPRGDYTNNPVFVTNAVTGVNIPLDTDTDGDQMPDWWEQQYGMDWTNKALRGQP